MMERAVEIQDKVTGIILKIKGDDRQRGKALSLHRADSAL
jgi:hypothetical protein